jgi:hypothetical protein
MKLRGLIARFECDRCGGSGDQPGQEGCDLLKLACQLCRGLGYMDNLITIEELRATIPSCGPWCFGGCSECEAHLRPQSSALGFGGGCSPSSIGGDSSGGAPEEELPVKKL